MQNDQAELSFQGSYISYNILILYNFRILNYYLFFGTPCIISKPGLLISLGCVGWLVEIRKKLKEGKLRPPKILKNHYFSFLGGPVTSTPLTFQNVEGTFVIKTFWIKEDPVEHFFKKILFRGKLKNLSFLGFLEKKLKVKIAYLWDFSAKK